MERAQVGLRHGVEAAEDADVCVDEEYGGERGGGGEGDARGRLRLKLLPTQALGAAAQRVQVCEVNDVVRLRGESALAWLGLGLEVRVRVSVRD